MNENSFSEVVGCLIWNEEKWSFYCNGCVREQNIKFYSEMSVCIGDRLEVHRIPQCDSCSKEIVGLSFITPIEVRPNTNEEHAGIHAKLAMKSYFPQATEWEEDLERFVARFAPEQLDKLISYIAESRGTLSVQFGSPVIEIQRGSKQQQSKPARKHSSKRSGNLRNGQADTIDLSAIQIIKSKQIKADWQELNCTRNNKMQCHVRSFASTLELLTFLEDYGGTLTLADLPHHQAIVPTITLHGKQKIANSAA